MGASRVALTHSNLVDEIGVQQSAGYTDNRAATLDEITRMWDGL